MKSVADYAPHRDRCLSSCIKIENQRISRDKTIPCQIHFELNDDIVACIEETIKDYDNLELEPQTLTELRYYSLINSPMVNGWDFVGSDRLSLVFSSSYTSDRDRRQIRVIRSKINLNGQISQEIQQDFWRDRYVSARAIKAHHWLTAEIFRQLPLKRSNSRVILFLALLLAIAFTWIVGYFFPLHLFSQILVGIICFICLKIVIKHVVVRQLKKWTIHHLASGWLSNKTKQRQIGFKILSLTINSQEF